MRVVLVALCADIPGLQTYLVRRKSVDLAPNHVDGPSGFRAMLGPWIASGHAVMIEGEIRFWNGSKIHLRHCQDDRALDGFQGAEIHVLCIDEGTQFTEKQIRFLRSRMRVPGLEVPERWRHRLPFFLMSANPIGIGVPWVKSWFIDKIEPFSVRQMPDDEGGGLRQFIPARLADNPTMEAGYAAKLSGLGNAAVVAAMLDGDWSAIEGAFFPDFMRIVIPAFEVPKNWLRYRSMDWGSARPFSVGWWAVANGEIAPFRAGELVRYREWYGASSANVGLKMHVPEVAAGIRARTPDDEEIAYTVADPAIFAEDGGPSLAEDFARAGVRCRPGDNKRAPGWQQITNRIAGYDDRPTVWCFENCRDSIRTIPYLVHDEHKAEDLDTEGEDHAADEWRYGCMSRPWIKPVEVIQRAPEFSFAQYIDPSTGKLVAPQRRR